LSDDTPVLPPADAPVTGHERDILEHCMSTWPHLHPDPMQCVLGVLDMNEEVPLWDDPAAVEDLRRHQRHLHATLEIYTERRLGTPA
jgi:hypothetical protein